MDSTKILLVLLLIFSLFVPQELFAEDAWDVDVKGGVFFEYDDNVTYSKNNEKDDFITNLLVGLGLQHEGKTHTFDLEGTFWQEIFSDNTSFNNNQQNVKAKLTKELSKHDRIMLEDKFTHAESAGSFEDEFGRTSGRYSFYRNRFNSEYIHDLSKQHFLKAIYGNESYDVSRSDLIDSFLHRIGIEWGYIHSSATTVLFAYEYLTRNADPGDSASRNTWSATIQHYVTKQLYFDSKVGVSLIDPYTGDDSTKPYIELSLTDEIDEKTKLILSFRKEHIPNRSREDIFDSWKISGELKRQLLERLSVIFAVFYGEGDFDPSGIEDKLTGVKIRFNYDVTEAIRAFIAHSYTQTDSNVSTRGYDKNSFLFGMTFDF